MEKPHKKLKVWQEAVDLSVATYKLTESFPKAELYGLVSQFRRAAVSVPANIAEGVARKGAKEGFHFVNIARASLSELDTHFEIASRVGYLTKGAHDELIVRMTKVDKLLFGFMKSLERNCRQGVGKH